MPHEHPTEAGDCPGCVTRLALSALLAGADHSQGPQLTQHPYPRTGATPKRQDISDEKFHSKPFENRSAKNMRTDSEKQYFQ